MTLSSVPVTPAPIRRGRKFDQVTQGALKVFLRDGFEGASVDEIAREAGVSKATLYSYFPDKKVMFTEVLTIECHRLAVEPERLNIDAMSVEDFLTYVARRTVEANMSDFGRQFSRLVIGEVSRFPELAREFYINGPGRLRRALVEYLRDLDYRGLLHIKPDAFELAAAQLLELSTAKINDRLRLGLVDEISTEEIRQSIDSAVAVFLSHYGVHD